MRGDLLFYTPKDWIGSIVAWSTNGPFSHVAIDMGDGTKIEADWNGIVRVKTINRAIAARFETGNIVPKLDDGMKWVQDQLGNPYGKEDILNQVLRLMGFKFYIGEAKRYDCSDLAVSISSSTPDAGWLLGSNRGQAAPGDSKRPRWLSLASNLANP